jgi:hypothetical protein
MNWLLTRRIREGRKDLEYADQEMEPDHSARRELRRSW